MSVFIQGVDDSIKKSLLTTIGDIIYASGVSTPARLAAGALGQMFLAQGAGAAPAYGNNLAAQSLYGYGLRWFVWPFVAGANTVTGTGAAVDVGFYCAMSTTAGGVGTARRALDVYIDFGSTSLVIVLGLTRENGNATTYLANSEWYIEIYNSVNRLQIRWNGTDMRFRTSTDAYGPNTTETVIATPATSATIAIVYEGAIPRATLYVNEVQVAQHTTNVPSNIDRWSPTFYLATTAAQVARLLPIQPWFRRI